ncbi:MAG: glycosyltransferase [Acidimicrobiales bacterium]
MNSTYDIALVHDYLTQRGGAERVALTLSEAFPRAPLYTSFYEPGDTLPGFAGVDVHTLALDRMGWLRRHHRLALPVLASAFGRLKIDAELAICSSSGWSHGASVAGRIVVYCHTPARWLYQSERYLEGMSDWAGVALSTLRPALRSWDQKAAARAARYLANSSAVRDRIRDVYGVDAEVVPPPVDLDPTGPIEPDTTMEPGYFLCVSRLLAYKNVEAVVEAFASLPSQRLVVVGSGPLYERIAGMAPANTTFFTAVSDARLRWLYASCSGLIAASYEDFGLTPIEAALFGRPTAALRWGGFLDTIVEGSTGVFFDEPRPEQIARAVRHLAGTTWNRAELVERADRYSKDRFIRRMRQVAEEERRIA